MQTVLARRGGTGTVWLRIITTLFGMALWLEWGEAVYATGVPRYGSRAHFGRGSSYSSLMRNKQAETEPGLLMFPSGGDMT